MSLTTSLAISVFFLILAILTSKYKARGALNSIFSSFLVFLFLCITLLYLSANHFTNEGINEGVIFTILYGLDGAGFGEYKMLIFIFLALFVIFIILSYFYFKSVRSVKLQKTNKIKGIFHNLFLLIAFLINPFSSDIYQIYKDTSYVSTKESTKSFNNFYKLYSNDKNSKNKNNLNLVWIYGEGLERTYFNETLFPGLMDNLRIIKNRSIDFSNMNQLRGGGITIAGIVSSQCGVPFFSYHSANSSHGIDSFYPGTKCLGDILSENQYYLTFMQGSSIEFAGMDKFLKTHKFDEIYGKYQFLPKLENKNYLNGWGLYDDTLFDYIYNRFEELSQKNKKFGLFLSTMDTHHPDGQPSKSCKNIKYGNGNNSILNAVKCSDYLISNFIKKIEESKYGDKTLIVLSSDHLGLSNKSANLLNRVKRKGLFIIIEPKNQEYINIDKNASPLDSAPTILNRLGLNGDLGLGRDLFVKESLYATVKNFNQRLLEWREDILKFWEFPKLKDNYYVKWNSLESQRIVKIGNNTYTFPLLIKINDDRSIEPFFTFHISKKISSYIKKFDKKQKFIWIDRCIKTNTISKDIYTTKFCIVQGKLGGNIKSVPINFSNIKMDTEDIFMESNISRDEYDMRVKNLSLLAMHKIQYTKNYFPKSTTGISSSLKWGIKWSNSDIVKFEFDSLPKKFVLEMRVGTFIWNLNKPIKVVIGDEEKIFSIKYNGLNKYTFSFSNINSKTIQIILPKSLKKNDNNFGIGFKSFTIWPSKK